MLVFLAQVSGHPLLWAPIGLALGVGLGLMFGRPDEGRREPGSLEWSLRLVGDAGEPLSDWVVAHEGHMTLRDGSGSSVLRATLLATRAGVASGFLLRRGSAAFPEVQNIPNPEWVEVGARITFESELRMELLSGQADQDRPDADRLLR